MKESDRLKYYVRELEKAEVLTFQPRKEERREIEEGDMSDYNGP